MENQPTTPEEEVEPADHPDALPPRQERALQALLTQPTRKAAAAAADISETALWRYEKDPVFARRLRDARREMSDQVITRLQHGAPKAISVLFDLADREDIAPRDRIAAIRLIADYHLRGTELQALRAEQEELKEYLRKKQDEEARRREREEARRREEGERADRRKLLRSIFPPGTSEEVILRDSSTPTPPQAPLAKAAFGRTGCGPPARPGGGRCFAIARRDTPPPNGPPHW